MIAIILTWIGIALALGGLCLAWMAAVYFWRRRPAGPLRQLIEGVCCDTAADDHESRYTAADRLGVHPDDLRWEEDMGWVVDTAALNLRNWFEALPGDDRYICELHYADRLTVAEIAAVLDLPQSTVAATLEATRAAAQEAIRQ